MKTRNYLLPYSYKKVGMWMFLPFAALCVCLFFSVSLPEIKVPWIAIGDDIFYKGEANLITTLGMLGLLVSLCFIALSREKDEDEMTGQIRMQSFVWSLWFTAIILALGILFIMGAGDKGHHPAGACRRRRSESADDQFHRGGWLHPLRSIGSEDCEVFW